eukprot:5971932-Pleurochrysis_carterae.AAC.2
MLRLLSKIRCCVARLVVSGQARQQNRRLAFTYALSKSCPIGCLGVCRSTQPDCWLHRLKWKELF